MQQTLTYPNGPRRSGLVAGLAVSILLHAVLLALWRVPEAPPMPPEARRWAEPLTVRILPPPPPVPAARVEPPEPPAAKPEKAPRQRPAARAERDRPERQEPDSAADTAIAVPAPSAEPAPAPAESAPKFDPDAARAAARAMANDLDVPSQNWAAEKLKKAREREETENERLGRNIARSARPDCKTAYAGAGLLAPLLMLMDKKDSGCKW